jgi:hypothetical protein
MGGEAEAGSFQPRGGSRRRASTTNTGRAHGCPWLGWDQPEAREWDYGSKEREARVGRTMSKSEKRTTQDEARAGRWLWQRMRSWADRQPHDAVKRAMGKQVGRYF